MYTMYGYDEAAGVKAYKKNFLKHEVSFLMGDADGDERMIRRPCK